MKFVIFDAGPIISLTMNGLLPVIEALQKNFDGKFILPPQVKREVIDKPMKIKKYKLEAIQVKHMYEKGVFTDAASIISRNDLDKEVQRILKTSNGFLRTADTGEKITIIHEGEAACLAFANLCKCDSLIVIDERTTRLLCEAPENLERLMEKKLHTPLVSEPSLLKELSCHKFVRSAELLFIAYKKGLIPFKRSKEVLDALLYGVKFKGAAISSKEIEAMKRLV